MDPSFSKDTILKNARRKKQLQSKDVDERRQGYFELYDEMAELSQELAKVDLTDDQSIVDNFELLSRAMFYGPELVNTLSGAESVGIDFNTPENKPILEKLGTVAEIGYFARGKVDVICHPAYAQMDMDQLADNLQPAGVALPNGETVGTLNLMGEYLGEDVPEGYAKVLGQYAMANNSLITAQELFDKSLTPEERVSKFQENYWNTSREFRPHPMQVEYKNGQLNKIDPEYGGFVDGSELEGNEDEKAAEEFEKVTREMEVSMFDEIIDSEGPKEPEIPEEIVVEDDEPQAAPREFQTVDPKLQTGDLIEGLPNIEKYRTVPQPVAEGPKTRQEALREMFVENVKTLQKLIPGFHVDPKEIDTYVSEERIRLHDMAVAKVNNYNEIKAQAPKKLPESFIRSYFAYVDKSGTPEGEKYNKRISENIKNPNPEGDRVRREMVSDMANRIQDLDAEKMSYDQPFNQQATYVMENLDTIEAAMEFERTHRGLASSTGLALPKEQEKHMKQVEAKGVIVGGIGRAVKEVMTTDLFLTLPFDKLPMDKISLLQKNAGLFKTEGTYQTQKNSRNQDELLREQMGLAQTFNNYKIVAQAEKIPDIQKHTYSPNDFTNITPTPEQYKEKFAGLLDKLNGTDAWYVRNSDQYKNMVSSVKNLIAELEKVGDRPILSEQKEKIFQCMNHISKDAKAYQNHATVSKNERREKRSNIAQELKDAVGILADPLMFDQFAERHNDASAKEYYDQVEKGQLPDEKELPFEEQLKVDQQEKTFVEGLTRTEKLREEMQNLEKKPELTNEDTFMLRVNGNIVEAREELANMVGRSEIDQEKARSLMATVMVGNMMKNMLKDKNNGIKLMETAVSGTERSDAFRSVTQDLNSEKINEFLSFDGEMKMLNGFQRLDNMLKNAPANQPAQQKELQNAVETVKKPEKEEMSLNG